MSTASNTGFLDRLRNAGTAFWLVLLGLSVVLFAANTGVATWQGSRLAGASAGASDLRVLSQQLAVQADTAAGGDAAAFEAFKRSKAEIESNISSLQSRYGNEVGVSDPIKQLVATWTPLGKNAEQLVAGEPALRALASQADAFNARVPQLQARLDELVRAMSTSGSPSSQVYIALREVVLSASMARRLSDIRAGGSNTALAGDALRRDAALFGQVLEGLRNGNAELGVAALRNGPALAALDQAEVEWKAMSGNLLAIQGSARNLFAAQAAARGLAAGADKLQDDSKRVFDALSSFGSVRDTRWFPNFWISVVSGTVLLLSIGGLLWSLYRSRQREQDTRYQAQVEFNSRNQQAIQRLLDEIVTLGEGDLTVNASVTEDVTGAIADAINATIDELRRLVATINDTSVKVSASSQETQATALQLAEAAQHQASEIDSASNRIREIAGSIDQVSRNSTESADVAQRSVQIAAQGASVVRKTIQGMDSIRDQIQETSKRIKRLGESSQEIGSIVELINDISEQTNILALNAAMQAASAGEAGRGFAVVADEVQRLAERTSGATHRIEALVQAIQSDTNAAVGSMEQTTAEVVSGARLAEDAGTALGEIERVSSDLNDLIKNISGAAQQQSAAASDITETMGVIRQITSQTSLGAKQTADSIGHLAQLAADLRRSVADFKLPG